MSTGELLGLGGLLVALATAAFVFIPAYRRARTEAHTADVDADDKIAARRLGELTRLYGRVDSLESQVKALIKADEAKDEVIGEQRDELAAVKRQLGDVQDAFKNYADRVAKAWEDGHTMPTLTTEELALLADKMAAPPAANPRKHRSKEMQ